MKPKIIKIRVINAWTKAMENQRPKKPMVSKADNLLAHQKTVRLC